MVLCLFLRSIFCKPYDSEFVVAIKSKKLPLKTPRLRGLIHSQFNQHQHPKHSTLPSRKPKFRQLILLGRPLRLIFLQNQPHHHPIWPFPLLAFLQPSLQQSSSLDHLHLLARMWMVRGFSWSSDPVFRARFGPKILQLFSHRDC